MRENLGETSGKTNQGTVFCVPNNSWSRYEEEDLVLTRFFLAESYKAVNRSEDSYNLYDAVLQWELKFCSPEDAQYTSKSMLPVVRSMGLADVEAELEALINQ